MNKINKVYVVVLHNRGRYGAGKAFNSKEKAEEYAKRLDIEFKRSYGNYYFPCFVDEVDYE